MDNRKHSPGRRLPLLVVVAVPFLFSQHMEPRYLDFSLYPNVPGSAPIDTSEDAAESMRESAPTLRAKALDVLRRFGPMTADEIAWRLEKSVLAIRPRITELFKMQLIEDTGLRSKNISGRRAVVWQAK